MSLLFIALALASLLIGSWLVVKKDSLQGFSIAIGLCFCFGGISGYFTDNPGGDEDSTAIIALGVALIIPTVIFWNAINRVTRKGSYKPTKE